jgi:hypothetical protein
VGHISNPIGLRLGFSRSWVIKNAQPLYYQDNIFKTFTPILNKFFKRTRFKRKNIIYSHSIIHANASLKYKIYIYLHDPFLEKRTKKCFNFVKKFIYNYYFKKEPIKLKDIKNKFLRKRYLVMKRRKAKSRKRRAKFIKIYSKKSIAKNKRKILNIIRTFLIKSFWKVLFYKKIYRLTKILIRRLKKSNSIEFFLIPISNANLNAKLLVNFALRKLKFRIRLDKIFKPLLKQFSSLIPGIRIICKGRFTRQQRATKTIFSKGIVKFSKGLTDIDFCLGTIPLKYGVGSLKIYIFKTIIESF